ncbi:hypothetical protein RRG08_019011 [Elysia crispata]|uniref:Uncharacterized protein n=1 Tax=Elysia crispata TaxID=231223 RepID=A0AAE1A565_9GAST|nr:hypothetical protein RRG08_019011 [Elysia crispata]
MKQSRAELSKELRDAHENQRPVTTINVEVLLDIDNIPALKTANTYEARQVKPAAPAPTNPRQTLALIRVLIITGQLSTKGETDTHVVAVAPRPTNDSSSSCTTLGRASKNFGPIMSDLRRCHCIFM